MVKLVYNDQLISIFAEDDHAMLVNAKEGADEAGDMAVPFLVYNIVASGQSIERGESSGHDEDNAAMMVAKELIRGGFQAGRGLGKNLQGILRPIELQAQGGTFGLGFHPNAKQLKELRELKRAEKEGRAPPMVFPPLRITFPRAAAIIEPEAHQAE